MFLVYNSISMAVMLRSVKSLAVKCCNPLVGNAGLQIC